MHISIKPGNTGILRFLVGVSVELWSFVPYCCFLGCGNERVPLDSHCSKMTCFW